MNLVLGIECFDFLRPFLHVKVFFMVQRDFLRININIDTFNGRKFTTDILDERSARCTVHAGDGDNRLQNESLMNDKRPHEKTRNHTDDAGSDCTPGIIRRGL